MKYTTIIILLLGLSCSRQVNTKPTHAVGPEILKGYFLGMTENQYRQITDSLSKAGEMNHDNEGYYFTWETAVPLKARHRFNFRNDSLILFILPLSGAAAPQSVCRSARIEMVKKYGIPTMQNDVSVWQNGDYRISLGVDRELGCLLIWAID